VDLRDPTLQRVMFTFKFAIKHFEKGSACSYKNHNI